MQRWWRCVLNNRLLPEWGARSLQLPPWHLPWISSLLCTKKEERQAWLTDNPYHHRSASSKAFLCQQTTDSPQNKTTLCLYDDETKSQPITELLPVAPEPTSHLPAAADPWEPAAPEDPQTEADVDNSSFLLL